MSYFHSFFLRVWSPCSFLEFCIWVFYSAKYSYCIQICIWVSNSAKYSYRIQNDWDLIYWQRIFKVQNCMHKCISNLCSCEPDFLDNSHLGMCQITSFFYFTFFQIPLDLFKSDSHIHVVYISIFFRIGCTK